MDDEFMKPTLLNVSSTLRVMTAQLRGMGDEGDDNAAEPFEDAEVAQPAGLMAKPALTTTSEALTIRRGDEAVAILLLDKGADPQVVETGETRLYGVGASNSAARIRIRNNGAIEITTSGNGGVTVTSTGTGTVVINSAAAVDINSGAGTNITLDAGLNIVLNGGSHHAARDGDTVIAAPTMATWIAALTTYVNALAPGTLTLPTDFGTVGVYPIAGSATVLLP